MRRKIALFFAVSMGIQPVAMAKRRDKGYTDIDNHWSKSIVARLDSYGVVKGYGDKNC